MSYHYPQKFKMAHKQVYIVPRQWLGCQNLESILYDEMRFYYRKYGECEGLILKRIGVKASFERYSDYLWARNEFDWASKPDKKIYHAVFVPLLRPIRTPMWFLASGRSTISWSALYGKFTPITIVPTKELEVLGCRPMALQLASKIIVTIYG
ncbi:hypothetical protein KQX54_017162 [Cotesia glomerata]|uniref:Uncharacterized protein n=1 Tax=Cotesia glomerata TaxID=32391 RepID=A0AAV7I6Y5_COTGL|nr:hypothetical protein KQX54_017162 [Cotesia glomerata]